MKCPKCKQETPDRSKSCQHCKAPLYPIQCYCGEWNTAEAKHCIQCQRDLTHINKRIEYSQLFNFRVSILAGAWFLFFLLVFIVLRLLWLKENLFIKELLPVGIFFLAAGLAFSASLILIEKLTKENLKKRKKLVTWAKRKRGEDLLYLFLVPFLGVVIAFSLGLLFIEWSLPTALMDVSQMQSFLPPGFLYFGFWWAAVGGIGGMLTGLILPSSGRHIFHSGSLAVKTLGSVITVNIAGLIVIPKVFFGQYQEMGSYLQGFLISTAIGTAVTFLLKKQLPLLGIFFWKLLKMMAMGLAGFIFFFIVPGGIFYLLHYDEALISYWVAFFLVALIWAELQAIALNPMTPVKAKFVVRKKKGTEEDSSW